MEDNKIITSEEQNLDNNQDNETKTYTQEEIGRAHV